MSPSTSMLAYQNFRYLKLSLAGLALIVVAYLWHDPLGGPNGGTPLGYALGVLGAGLIGWLMWFGIRKRQYHRAGLPLKAWLSAHVYLGTALAVIGTLHTGFQFGWNIHTLAWGLMMVVIVSGMFGVSMYTALPRQQTRNLRGQTMKALLLEIAGLNDELRRASQPLSDEINRWIQHSNQKTQIGGTVWQQLRGSDRRCATALAFSSIRQLGPDVAPALQRPYRQVLVLMSRKENLLGMVRRDVQIRALLSIWLYAHVPLSFALIAALCGHILSVFFFW